MQSRDSQSGPAGRRGMRYFFAGGPPRGMARTIGLARARLPVGGPGLSTRVYSCIVFDVVLCVTT